MGEVTAPEAAVSPMVWSPNNPDGLRSDAVTVGYVYQGNPAASWHHSIIEMVAHDLAAHGRVIKGGWVAVRTGTDGLPQARNMVVSHFLERESDWLLWLDTDMGFKPDTVDRLWEVADPDDRPIVGGLCFSQRESAPDGMGGWFTEATPTVFDWETVNEKRGFTVRYDYPRNELVRCAGTGSACVLVHRSVFEKIDKEFGTWYTRIENTDLQQLSGEDLSFCMRADFLDIPIHVHTGVKTSHQKTVWLSEEDYLIQRYAAAAVRAARASRVPDGEPDVEVAGP